MRDSPRNTAGRQQKNIQLVFSEHCHINDILCCVCYHGADKVFKFRVLHYAAVLVVFNQRFRPDIIAPFFFSDLCGAARQRLLLQSVIDKIFRSSEIPRGHLNRHAAFNREDFFFCRLWFQNSRHFMYLSSKNILKQFADLAVIRRCYYRQHFRSRTAVTRLPHRYRRLPHAYFL